MNVVTYNSVNQLNPDYKWLAYIVLPNGEFWNVRFNGATEEIARSKALALWEKEKDKVLRHNEPEVFRDINIYKGEKWLCVYLDNARKGMEKNKFRAQLAVLAKAGLYRVVDGYAFGDVKESD